jgi:hypothetical protein
MGTTLTGTTPQDTYDSLIKVTDNGPIGATAKRLTDGLGNDSTLALSTTNVLVNHTNTPKGDLDVAASTNAVHLALRGRSGDNAGQAEFWSYDGATRYGILGSTPNFSIFGSVANTFLYFITNSTERMRITADGYVRLATTSSGIQFNGDTAAANALDDYEEGTWTMGVSFGGASVGVTFFVNTGTYTKIGRQVTVNGLVSLTSKGSSTGAATITGLPFTSGSGLSNSSVTAIALNNITFANQIVGRMGGASTSISLAELTELGVQTTITDADFANNSDVTISLTYFV